MPSRKSSLHHGRVHHGRAAGAALRFSTAFPAALVVFGVLAACGTRDSGSVDTARGATLEPTAEEVYRVGSMSGDAWDGFTRISSLAFDAEGRLVILDQGQRRVHIVAPDGSHVRSFGTTGDGPGEFRSPSGVAVLEDGRIVVSDGGHSSFLTFTPEGRWLRSHSMDPGGGLPGPRLQPQGSTAVVAIAQGFRVEVTAGSGPPRMPSTVPIRRWELDGESDPETLIEAWRPERPQPGAVSLGAGAMASMAPRALEPQVHLAVLPDGRLAVADTSSYRIRIYGPAGPGDGEPVTIGREIAPMPVGPAEEEAERMRRLADLEAGGGPRVEAVLAGPGGSVSPVPQEQIREMLKAQVDQLRFWHEVPVILRLASDLEGRLWVERSAGIGEEGPIDILRADGEWLGTIEPGGLRTPMAFGPQGLAAWIETDDLDVPYVRVARLQLLPE